MGSNDINATATVIKIPSSLSLVCRSDLNDQMFSIKISKNESNHRQKRLTVLVN